MKTLSHRLDEYLLLRRTMGYDLSFAERVLRKFVAHAEESGLDWVSTSLFLDWRTSYGNADNNTWSNRLSIVRQFAIWLAGHDARTEIPSSQLIPGRYRRRTPYIYTPEQIAQLVDKASRLPSAFGLRGALWKTVFGLIAVTGMRVNEALSVNRQDVDFERGVITIQHAKNGKDRQIPVRRDTIVQLKNYARMRDRILLPGGPKFFVRENGASVKECTARYNFAKVSQNIGLRSLQDFNRHGEGPRIHDLRHSFAVHTIIDWFRDGRNVDTEMYKLSAYLGHSEPKHTYWYIEAVPELMELAASRAEQQTLGVKQ